MKNFKSITVAELIEQLQQENPDALVVFAADYGDHCHTEQALPVRGECEEVTLEESAYSNSGLAIASEESDDEDGDDDNVVVVVIR